MRDSILGPRDHNLSQGSRVTNWTTQASHECGLMPKPPCSHWTSQIAPQRCSSIPPFTVALGKFSETLNIFVAVFVWLDF